MRMTGLGNNGLMISLPSKREVVRPVALKLDCTLESSGKRFYENQCHLHMGVSNSSKLPGDWLQGGLENCWVKVPSWSCIAPDSFHSSSCFWIFLWSDLSILPHASPPSPHWSVLSLQQNWNISCRKFVIFLWNGSNSSISISFLPQLHRF